MGVSGGHDGAVLSHAVGRALAVPIDRHGSGAHQSVGLTGIREGRAAGEHCGGNQHGGEMAEGSHDREPFVSGWNARTVSAEVPLVD